MPVFTPSRAAVIANGVYHLRDKSVTAAHDADLQLGCGAVQLVLSVRGGRGVDFNRQAPLRVKSLIARRWQRARRRPRTRSG